MDSLRHQIQKLAESRANRTSTSAAAPPPYSSDLPRRSLITTASPTIMDEPGWDDPVVPITITIDSSIDVFGNNNTVILPSASSPRDTAPCPGTDSEATASPATATSSHQVRTTKVGDTAAIIIAALKRAGGLTDDLGRTRPIQIGIKSGVKIDGENNTICTGGTQPPRAFAYSPPVPVGEKRRAASVCTFLSRS